jgi:hypothetical protein
VPFSGSSPLAIAVLVLVDFLAANGDRWLAMIIIDFSRQVDWQ